VRRGRERAGHAEQQRPERERAVALAQPTVQRDQRRGREQPDQHQEQRAQGGVGPHDDERDRVAEGGHAGQDRHEAAEPLESL
jgi:hypothetical protein